MLTFLFGMDRDAPEAFARALAVKGYRAAVCAPDNRQIGALRDAGLDAYLCVPAFPLSDGGDHCLDVDGVSRVWFSSACPCDEKAAARGIERIAKAAETPGVKGLFLDGARFASPASAEGPEAFFTCFCPHCMARAEKLGLDLEEGRRQLLLLREGKAQAFPPVLADFRAGVIADYFARFIAVCHGAGIEANAFVFAPSLSKLVGQTAAACEGLDVLSPMLYRAYPHSFGTACLNHEHDALLRLFGRDTAQAMTGVTLPEEPKKAGFSPAHLMEETIAACAGFSSPVAPILQLEDAAALECAAAVKQGGASGVGFFAYADGGADALPDVTAF